MPDGSRDVIQRDRAWSTFELKSLDEKTRTFEGIASTPNTDFGGDVVDPFGAQFSLPIPLLWQHAKEHIKDPVGQITHARATPAGIYIKGTVAKFDEPPSLKDDVDRAWQLIKTKLVRGLSIGFRPEKYKANKAGGYDISSWNWHELSAVRVGMNQDATITAIKSIDQSSRAAPGSSTSPSPGASGKSNHPRSKTMPGIADRLNELVSKSTEMKDRMTELSQKCEGDVSKLSKEELAEFDGLNADLDPIEKDITRYQGMQRAASKSHTIDTNVGTDPERATRVRNGDFQMKSNLPGGTMFTRAVLARARAMKAGAGVAEASEFARKEWPDTPQVAQYIKANPGTGLSGNWAEPLNVVNTVENDFISLLRPETIIGRLNLRPAPFNVKMIRQTGGSTAGWVGRAVAKPVGELAFDTVTVPQSKIAGIVVLTDDQIMSSHIDSVEATRRDMIAQVAQYADQQFTDPSVAAVADVNPASVTYGVNDVPSTGNTAEDLRANLVSLLNRFSAAHIGLGGVVLVTSSSIALGIASLTNALGQPEFPMMNVDGGSMRGMRVIVSDNIPGNSTSSYIIAIREDSVLLAQSGGIKVDMSRDATIDMAGGNSPTYSLFQKNSVALRTEWWVSWVKARAAAVQYISGAAYAPAAP